MPQIRGNTAAKWARRAGSAGEEYKEGVANPRTSWQAATTAAAGAQKAGVEEALREKRFEKGVAKAGDQKWSQKAQTKGAERFGPGVASAQQDYEQAVAPYLQVIASTNLPPRGPKGDPKNFERVKVMAMALRNKKTGKA